MSHKCDFLKCQQGESKFGVEISWSTEHIKQRAHPTIIRSKGSTFDANSRSASSSMTLLTTLHKEISTETESN